MINLGTMTKTGASETSVKKATGTESRVKVDATETANAVKQDANKQKQGHQKKHKTPVHKQTAKEAKAIKAETDPVYDEKGKKSVGSHINISI